MDFPINYVELEEGILDAVAGGPRDVPYTNFNFKVELGNAEASAEEQQLVAVGATRK